MGFYCDNCGKEVNRNTTTCPECGVRFKAVKCPSCGYTDEADFFKGGCPRCGYSGKNESVDLEIKNQPESPPCKNPVLDFISSRAFWLMSGVLLFLLIFIFYKISQDT
ncbi:zinc ribbon domain-containing protein [Oceanispirochaeta sp.]|jgi:uncharacterized membrane protein YvbJ|uniref:double zinc ribbon domain-containing protein n=1 Tax=Oceanispirochaeta sp. TaxID=2035350 RepID=UPI00260811A8|nr:zinc ribbon domain-containing protein [Oceanispirochaeta sp.]MDA3956994.1 hypothetical protein [Oceanispirochaeta sp.]